MAEDKYPGSDAEFADRTLGALPRTQVPDALRARIMADFDTVAAKRRAGLLYELRVLAGTIWPGAPLWKPGAVFAASLLCGLAAGAFVPVLQPAQDDSASLRQQWADASPALDMLGDL